MGKGCYSRYTVLVVHALVHYSIVKITLSSHLGFVCVFKVYLPSPSTPGSCNSPLESDDRCGDDRCCGGTAEADCDNDEFNPSTGGYLHAIRACLGRDPVAGVYDSLPPNNRSLFGFSCKGAAVIVDCDGDVFVDGDVIVDGTVYDGEGGSSSDWCFGNFKECVKALWTCGLSGYWQACGGGGGGGGEDGDGGSGGQDDPGPEGGSDSGKVGDGQQAYGGDGGGGDGGEDGNRGGGRDYPVPGGSPDGGEVRGSKPCSKEEQTLIIYSFYRFPPDIPSDIQTMHVVLPGPYQDKEARIKF